MSHSDPAKFVIFGFILMCDISEGSNVLTKE
jgi:hypothetical protein